MSAGLLTLIVKIITCFRSILFWQAIMTEFLGIMRAIVAILSDAFNRGFGKQITILAGLYLTY